MRFNTVSLYLNFEYNSKKVHSHLKHFTLQSGFITFQFADLHEKTWQAMFHKIMQRKISFTVKKAFTSRQFKTRPYVKQNLMTSFDAICEGHLNLIYKIMPIKWNNFSFDMAVLCNCRLWELYFILCVYDNLLTILEYS